MKPRRREIHVYNVQLCIKVPSNHDWSEEIEMEITLSIIVASNKVGKPKLFRDFLERPIAAVNVEPIQLFHSRLGARYLHPMLHGPQ